MSDYGYSSPGQPSAVPNSTMAIVSLIAGFLGLTFFPLFGSIVAVVTGRMAKQEIAESGGRLGGEGLAQIGMILGWVGVALSLVGCCIAMVAIVLPLLIGLLAVGAETYGLLAPALLLL